MNINIVVVGVIILITIIGGILYGQKNKNIETNIVQITDNLFDNKKYDNFTIIDFFKYVAKMYPDKHALKIKNGKDGWKEITYSTYYKNIQNFAYALNYWLGPKANIAIIGSNCPGWVYSHLGCMLNGGSSTGIYASSTTKMCKSILKNSNAELLVVDGEKQLEKFIDIDLYSIKMIIYYTPVKEKTVAKFKIPVISMGNFVEQQNKSNSEFKPEMDDIACVYDGHEMTHGEITNSLRQIMKLIITKSTVHHLSEEQIISYLPLNHSIVQIFDIYMPIVTLSTVWFASTNVIKPSSNYAYDKDILAALMTEIKPTIFIGMANIWENFMDIFESSGSFAKTFSPWKMLEDIGLGSCKLAFSFFNTMMDNVKSSFDSIGLNVFEIYGINKYGPISMSLPGLNRIGSVGAPLMPVKISKTNEIMVNDNLPTWDIGKLDNDGFLYIIGKKKHMITMNEQQFSPVSLENILKRELGKYFEHIIVTMKNKKIVVLLKVYIDKQLPSNINNIVEIEINKIKSICEIKKWKIIKNKFKIGNELLASLKLNREFIANKYL